MHSLISAKQSVGTDIAFSSIEMNMFIFGTVHRKERRMHPARCIPLNFRYRQDPPNTDWWVMHQPPVVEDESPVLADAESWLSLSAMPAPVQPGTIHHREERGEVVVTVLVPCDSHGRIEPDVQQAHQQIADEFFWQLRPTAELV